MTFSTWFLIGISVFFAALTFVVWKDGRDSPLLPAALSYSTLLAAVFVAAAA